MPPSLKRLTLSAVGERRGYLGCDHSSAHETQLDIVYALANRLRLVEATCNDVLSPSEELTTTEVEHYVRVIRENVHYGKALIAELCIRFLQKGSDVDETRVTAPFA